MTKTVTEDDSKQDVAEALINLRAAVESLRSSVDAAATQNEFWNGLTTAAGAVVAILGILAGVYFVVDAVKPPSATDTKALASYAVTNPKINSADLPFQFGDEVEITRGMYRGFRGRITDVDAETLEYEVRVEFLPKDANDPAQLFQWERWRDVRGFLPVSLKLIANPPYSKASKQWQEKRSDLSTRQPTPIS